MEQNEQILQKEKQIIPRPRNRDLGIICFRNLTPPPASETIIQAYLDHLQIRIECGGPIIVEFKDGYYYCVINVGLRRRDIGRVCGARVAPG
jgi:hypothetical protein